DASAMLRRKLRLSTLRMSSVPRSCVPHKTLRLAMAVAARADSACVGLAMAASPLRPEGNPYFGRRLPTTRGQPQRPASFSRAQTSAVRRGRAHPEDQQQTGCQGFSERKVSRACPSLTAQWWPGLAARAMATERPTTAGGQMQVIVFGQLKVRA